MKKAALALLLLCLAAVNAHALPSDLNTVVARGELARTREWRLASTNALVRAQVVLRERFGSEVYAVPFECHTANDCLQVSFSCTPVTNTYSDPLDSSLNITDTECATFTAGNCYLIEGWLRNDSSGRAEVVSKGGPAAALYASCEH